MENREADYYFAMYRKFLNSYNEFMMSKLKRYALSPNEMVVITCMKESSKASEIASMADVSKALISRSVKYLKNKGLIEIKLDSKDKREQTLSLTNTGEELYDLIEKYKAEFYEKAFEGFSADERAVLQALLKLMGNNLNNV